MDNQHSPLLDWAYFCQEKSMEDQLRQTLLLTAMELENTRLKAQEELKMRDDQLMQLNDLLNITIKQRDKAQEKCRKLLFEKLMRQQHRHIQQSAGALISGASSIEDEPRKVMESNNGFSSSDCDESIVSSPSVEPVPPPLQLPPEEEQELALPEKGKLLQAVMKAGPLLQTLLLAGPLPQWRHPPPPLDTYQIPPPPVLIPSSPPLPPSPAFPIHSIHQDFLLNLTSCNNNNINNRDRLTRKRGFNYESDTSPSEAKYRRVVLQ